MIVFASVCLLLLLVQVDALPMQSWTHQDSTLESRLAVIENKRPPINFVLVFHTNDGSLRFKQQLKRTWSQWHDLGAPSGTKLISNPVAVHDLNNQTNIFCLCADGQVYSLKQDPIKLVYFGNWTSVGSSKIPSDSGVSLRGQDNVGAINYRGKLTVFTRSITKSSHLYWTQENGNTWDDWTVIGGSSVSLMSDVAVAYNGFSKYLEAFAIMENNKLYRTWQTGPKDWVSWDKTGYEAPSTSHAPVVHSMSHNLFNGMLNVFILSNDGSIHHIWQTTCDKVPNPWGWCTWSVWNTIGDKVPPGVPSLNPLSIGSNIHEGIELFTVGSEGSLWHLWQLYRHGDWSTWESVGSPASGPMASHPTVITDEKGWWAAYALDSKDTVEVIEQNRSLTLSAQKIQSGKPVTVSWSVPVDEATHQDWIGVYPSGKDNHFYVDFYYVGGGQNPLKDAVPKGSLTFKSYLPDGKYDYRYLANKQFFDAVNASLMVTDGPKDKEWIQLYRGIGAGLGKGNVSFEKCVKDGNQTVALFKQAFDAFEDREIYKGIQLIGQALKDVYKAFEDCGETDIAKALEKLASDFISCTMGNCVNFVVDVAAEILVLFEDIYEIYGDIRGASNAFKIDAYEQGGYSIGRVIAVCISLPS